VPGEMFDAFFAMGRIGVGEGHGCAAAPLGWMNGSFGGGAVSDLRRSRGAIGIVVRDAASDCFFLRFQGMG